MTLHCGKGMNEMERAICGMIHTSGFMSVSPVPFPFPFPSLNSLPSFILHPSVHPSLHSGASITPSFSVWLRPTAMQLVPRVARPR